MKFVYKARTKTGEVKDGMLEATDDMMAISKLQNMGLYIISLVGETTSSLSAKQSSVVRLSLKEKGLGKKVKKKGGVSSEDIILFFDQMAVLLEASVDMLKTLDVLSLQVGSQKLENIVLEMKTQIAGGSSLSAAMVKYPKIFSPMMKNLVEIGESSGKLPDVLRRITQHLQRTEEIKSKLKRALIYPAILLCLSFVVLIAFMVFFIPMFQKIFGDFNIELPALTRGVIAVSNFVRKYIFLEILAGGGLIFIIRNLLKIPQYRFQVDEYSLKIPVIGSLLLRTAIVNFTNSFSVLLMSGVSMIDALELVKGSINNMFLSEVLNNVKTKVRAGSSISKGLEDAQIFPPIVTQMIGIGEETGRLTDMLDRVSEFYEKRVSAAVEAMAALFEPLILVFMGLLVGTLVISMFLPIFKVSQIGSAG